MSKRTKFDPRNDELLNTFYSIYLSETNSRLPHYIPRNTIEPGIKMVFVNGRYHGLLPSTGPDYNGHPGLFNQAFINALCLGAKKVVIIMSAKYEGYDTSYPIEPEVKKEFIQEWIEILKERLPHNIIEKLKHVGAIREEEEVSFHVFLTDKIENILTIVKPMGSGNPLLLPIWHDEMRESNLTPDETLMITGLEEKGGEKYNKYSTTFSGAKFILLARDEELNNISGTKIRKTVMDDDYSAIAKWLINSNMTDNRILLLVGKIIHSINHSQQTDSQEETYRLAEHVGLEEFLRLNSEIKNLETETLKSSDSSSFLGGSKRNKTKRNKTKRNKTKRNKTKRNKTKRNKTKRKY